MIRVRFKGAAVDAHKPPGVHLRLWLALAIAADVWGRHGASELVVTSLNDGEHRPGSFHYAGDAADLRVWNLPKGSWRAAADDLALAVGPDFDVVLEKDHAHIEWDPDQPPGVESA